MYSPEWEGWPFSLTCLSWRWQQIFNYLNTACIIWFSTYLSHAKCSRNFRRKWRVHYMRINLNLHPHNQAFESRTWPLFNTLKNILFVPLGITFLYFMVIFSLLRLDRAPPKLGCFGSKLHFWGIIHTYFQVFLPYSLTLTTTSDIWLLKHTRRKKNMISITGGNRMTQSCSAEHLNKCLTANTGASISGFGLSVRSSCRKKKKVFACLCEKYSEFSLFKVLTRGYVLSFSVHACTLCMRWPLSDLHENVMH